MAQRLAAAVCGGKEKKLVGIAQAAKATCGCCHPDLHRYQKKKRGEKKAVIFFHTLKEISNLNEAS